jgi:hypothetical protein
MLLIVRIFMESLSKDKGKQFFHASPLLLNRNIIDLTCP